MSNSSSTNVFTFLLDFDLVDFDLLIDFNDELVTKKNYIKINKESSISKKTILKQINSKNQILSNKNIPKIMLDIPHIL